MEGAAVLGTPGHGPLLATLDSGLRAGSLNGIKGKPCRLVPGEPGSGPLSPGAHGDERLARCQRLPGLRVVPLLP